MFDAIINYWKVHRARSAIMQHPVLGLAARHMTEMLSDTTGGIGKYFSEEGKNKIYTDMLVEIDQLLVQPDPLKAIRMRTMDFMLLASKYDVLQVRGQTTIKEVSGELYKYIPQLVKADKELEDLLCAYSADDGTPEKIGDVVYCNYYVNHFRMSAYNAARQGLRDVHFDDRKDWFVACYMSFCIWQENRYRTLLTLPSLIAEDPTTLKSIAYSSAWIKCVEDGHKVLRAAFEKTWESAFQEPFQWKGVSVPRSLARLD